MSERERYRTYTVPGGTSVAISDETAGAVVEAAIYYAQRLNELDGNLPSNAGGAAKMAQRSRLAALERIFAEYLSVSRVEYYMRVLAVVGDSLERAERYAALERDNFRCVLCQHTASNAGGVESHHITARSYESPIVGKMFDHNEAGIHCKENLATLCHRCHGRISDPASADWTWQEKASELYRAIGEPGFAALWDRRSSNGA